MTVLKLKHLDRALALEQRQEHARSLTPEEQEVMRRALRRSVTIIDACDFRFPDPKPQTLTGKWCAHCAKDTHDDAECGSTRAIDPSHAGRTSNP